MTIQSSITAKSKFVWFRVQNISRMMSCSADALFRILFLFFAHMSVLHHRYLPSVLRLKSVSVEKSPFCHEQDYFSFKWKDPTVFFTLRWFVYAYFQHSCFSYAVVMMRTRLPCAGVFAGQPISFNYRLEITNAWTISLFLCLFSLCNL